MIILQDNKEQTPWDLEFFDEVEEQKVVHLVTGDYSIEGLESVVTIERKRTTGEIALNLGQKYKAFAREFDRLQTFEYRYIICEFTFDDILSFPINSGIPKRFWSKLRISGKFILSRLEQLCNDHEVELILCGNKENAERTAYKILKSINDEKKKQTDT
jgi:hypothetical protein